VIREFKDAVFEDVAFRNDGFCGDFTPKTGIGEGFNIYYYETPHPQTPHL
jgi:hypothetical protein